MLVIDRMVHKNQYGTRTHICSRAHTYTCLYLSYSYFSKLFKVLPQVSIIYWTFQTMNNQMFIFQILYLLGKGRGASWSAHVLIILVLSSEVWHRGGGTSLAGSVWARPPFGDQVINIQKSYACVFRTCKGMCIDYASSCIFMLRAASQLKFSARCVRNGWPLHSLRIRNRNYWAASAPPVTWGTMDILLPNLIAVMLA